MTAQPIKLRVKVIKGAKINNNVSALLGIIVSLRNNFNPSDKGCNIPIKPITFGPSLLWIAPKILRSAKVKYATEINKGKIMKKGSIILIVV